MKLTNPKRSIRPNALTYGKGAIILNGPMTVPYVDFRPNRDYTYCRICGRIFQPWLNRVPDEEYTQEVILAAELLRREWSQTHAKTHSDKQHRDLKLSGRHCTPEALQALVPYGIIPVSDLVMDNESMHAGLEAPRMPEVEVES